MKDTLDFGVPVGLQDEIKEMVAQMDISLQPGDGVVLYSDGITESKNELMNWVNSMAWNGCAQ